MNMAQCYCCFTHLTFTTSSERPQNLKTQNLNKLYFTLTATIIAIKHKTKQTGGRIKRVKININYLASQTDHIYVP